MIDVDFPTQIKWLNDYHKLTLETMEPLLTSDLAKAWLRDRTHPYTLPISSSSAAQSCVLAMATVVMATVATLTSFTDCL